MATARAFRLVALILALALLPGAAFAAATITVVNMDGPGEGFNDPTAVAPVGGNPGPRAGPQRLIAFQHAANIWGAVLDSPETIYVQASFDPLTCTATGAVLGAAGAIQIFADFPGREFDDTWYHVALANKLAGGDLAPGANGTTADDIVAFFNSNLNGNPACLGGRELLPRARRQPRHRHRPGDRAAPRVRPRPRLRQLRHRGDRLAPARPRRHLLRVHAGRLDRQALEPDDHGGAVASAINSRKVVWDGLHVTNAIPGVLAFGTPLLTVNSPAGLGPYDVGAASFGPPITAPGVTGNLVQAIDRGRTGSPRRRHGVRRLLAVHQRRGGRRQHRPRRPRLLHASTSRRRTRRRPAPSAMIVADNAPGAPPAGLGGVDPTITIPSARVTLPAGNALKAALGSGTVNVTLGVDLVRARRRRGVDRAGAPQRPEPGAARLVDLALGPDRLPQPAHGAVDQRRPDPQRPAAQDLSLKEMTDIGWFSDGDGVPDGRDACLGSTAPPW